MDDLTVHQEGPHVRVKAGRLNFLFPNSDCGAIEATYIGASANAEEHFAPRARSDRGPACPDEVLGEIVRESTLHWMQFYILNHRKVRITAADWDHPLTRRIIQRVVRLAFPPGAAETSEICARLMGVSVDAYKQWSEGDEYLQSMF